MTLAITYAANTTVAVTWTTPAGTVATAEFPTHLHAAYADSVHSSTVANLADPAVAPAYTTTQSGVSGGVIGGLGGASLVGLLIIVWFGARWKHHSPDVKKHFILGAVAAILVGSWGLFGVFSDTVKTTGNSVGTSVGNTISQQQTSLH